MDKESTSQHRGHSKYIFNIIFNNLNFKTFVFVSLFESLTHPYIRHVRVPPVRPQHQTGQTHQSTPSHEGLIIKMFLIFVNLFQVFPETNQALMDARSSVAWNQHDTRHVIRFPLNGYCKLNSVQAITRLLNAGFNVVASNGGGVEGQQFSEYLFVRKVQPFVNSSTFNSQTQIRISRVRFSRTVQLSEAFLRIVPIQDARVQSCIKII